MYDSFMNADDLLKEYDSNLKTYEQLSKISEAFITNWLDLKGIRVHTVTSRVKDRKSMAEKLTRQGKHYERLSDVTDIVGIRVITHFEHEIDKIGAIIESKLAVDLENSSDKRTILDPDRFGYLSRHYICSLSPKNLDLPETNPFMDLKFEIQIRSILQHAWAEIEHDLGYKRGHGIPFQTKRRFARIAGLLEIADREFTAISEELRQYESHVVAEVGRAPANLGIDKITLKTICERDPVREIDKELANGIGAEISENDGLLSLLSIGLPFVEINTAEQLVETLKRKKDLVLYQAVERYRGKRLPVSRGSAIMQLLLVLMGERGGVNEILRGMTALGRGPDPSFAQEVMQKIDEFKARKSKIHGVGG